MNKLGLFGTCLYYGGVMIMLLGLVMLISGVGDTVTSMAGQIRSMSDSGASSAGSHAAKPAQQKQDVQAGDETAAPADETESAQANDETGEYAQPDEEMYVQPDNTASQPEDITEGTPPSDESGQADGEIAPQADGQQGAQAEGGKAQGAAPAEQAYMVQGSNEFERFADSLLWPVENEVSSFLQKGGILNLDEQIGQSIVPRMVRFLACVVVGMVLVVIGLLLKMFDKLVDFIDDQKKKTLDANVIRSGLSEKRVRKRVS